MCVELSVGVGLDLNGAIIDVLTSGQHHRRVNLQGNGFGRADNQDHAHGLHPAGPFLQLRFIGFGAVCDSDQIAVAVVQTDFADPPAAFILRNYLLGHDLVGVLRVDA